MSVLCSMSVGCLSRFDMLNDPPHSCRFLAANYPSSCHSSMGLNRIPVRGRIRSQKPMKLPYDWGNDHLFTVEQT